MVAAHYYCHRPNHVCTHSNTSLTGLLSLHGIISPLKCIGVKLQMPWKLFTKMHWYPCNNKCPSSDAIQWYIQQPSLKKDGRELWMHKNWRAPQTRKDCTFPRALKSRLPFDQSLLPGPRAFWGKSRREKLSDESLCPVRKPIQRARIFVVAWHRFDHFQSLRFSLHAFQGMMTSQFHKVATGQRWIYLPAIFWPYSMLHGYEDDPHYVISYILDPMCMVKISSLTLVNALPSLSSLFGTARGPNIFT